MPTTSLDAFLARWSLAGGGEMANSHSALNVPRGAAARPHQSDSTTGSSSD